MIFKSFSLLFILFTLNYSAFAEDIRMNYLTKNSIGTFSIGIGSTLNLNLKNKNLLSESIFLGNVLKSDGQDSYRMYLNKTQNKIYYIDSTNFSTSKNDSQLQTLIDPSEQAGGTCTG